MRHDAITPDPDAATLHEPSKVLAPADAAFIQSAGNTRVASNPLGSAAAQLAGSAPENNFSRAEVPTVVSIASNSALRTATDFWKAIFQSSIVCDLHPLRGADNTCGPFLAAQMIERLEDCRPMIRGRGWRRRCRRLFCLQGDLVAFR